MSLLTCRNFFVSVSVFSLSLTLLLLLFFRGYNKPNKQTSEQTKKKISSKHNLQLWLPRVQGQKSTAESRYLTCRKFFVYVFSLSLFNFSFVVIVFPGLQQTKQTNKEKKIVKTQLAAWYHEKKCEKKIHCFFSFFLTKKWKNKNCDDDSLAKNKQKSD